MWNKSWNHPAWESWISVKANPPKSIIDSLRCWFYKINVFFSQSTYTLASRRAAKKCLSNFVWFGWIGSQPISVFLLQKWRVCIQVLIWSWTTVCDAGPTLNQHWIIVYVVWTAVTIWTSDEPTYYRSKHEAFTQCCFNVGPPSSTLAQH